MKNIHVLPTDKPSRLIIYSTLLNEFRLLDAPIDDWKHKQHIYITNDEEIKEGYYYDLTHNIVMKSIFYQSSDKNCKKIILTTNEDLIKDGVQAIDDEFLEWFVKNSSCEEVEVVLVSVNEFGSEVTVNGYGFDRFIYKIIIPKESKNSCDIIFETASLIDEDGPKQETLEEVRVVKRTELYNSILSIVKQIPRKEVEGDAMDAPSCAYELQQLFLKWQQERMYSEAIEFAEWIRIKDFQTAFKDNWIGLDMKYYTTEELFEQFKKK